MRRKSTARVPSATALLALLAMTLVTAGCGARWTDEQQAQVLARADSDGGGQGRSDRPGNVAARGDGTSTSAPGSGTGGPTDAPAGTGSPETTAGGSPDASSGAENGATGEADGGAGGPLPCAAPSDATGVTDDTLRVGSISSLSGPVPGLGAPAAAAARAHVEYRNATGGVCGRQIELQSADDGTDNGRYRSLIQDLNEEVFGIAGGFAVGDVGGADIVGQTGIPVVNNPSADVVGQQPTAFDMNPPYENPDRVIGKYRYLREQGATEASVTYIAVDQSRTEAQLQQRLMTAAGIEVVQVQELPLSTISYDSAARSVANSGADYLVFIGDANANGAMARSMEKTDHSVEFEEYYAFAYEAGFIELAGAEVAEGAISWIRSLPNEAARSNEEMARFVEWMDRVAPGEAKDSFAADSWVSAKAFFDSLEGLPGPISREALVNQLNSVGTYDAGGMFGPIRLGEERTNGCFIGMQVRSGSWERLAPSDGFLC